MGTTKMGAVVDKGSTESRAGNVQVGHLSWTQSDIEQRVGFRGGRFTRTNNVLTFLSAVILTTAFYALLIPLQGSHFASMFTDRGIIPYFICLFAFWSLSILIVKWTKLRLQRRALLLAVTPDSSGFILSSGTVDQVFARIYELVDDPKHFVVLNRIVIALANLRNLGRVTDVDEMLRSGAEHDESVMETSYSLLAGFIWAIPVLGFIGTVVGLSQAIGGFGDVLGRSEDMSEITASLRDVTAGLATAFETTLIALVAALAIQIIYTFLRKSEEEFLDSCSEYCHRNIVNRLRLMPFQQEME